MHPSQRPTLRRVLTPAAALALAFGVLVTGPGVASAAPPPADSAAVGDTSAAPAGTIRTLTRNASLAFPAGKPAGAAPVGVQSPELPPADPEATVIAKAQRPRPTAASLDALSRNAAAAGALSAPVVASSTVTATPQGLAAGFEGLNFFDQRTANGGNQFSLEPPDQALCVGNGFTVEAVNDVLQVYRAGGQPATPVIDLNSFYGYPAAVNRTPGAANPFGPFVTDPVCLFDKPTNRFFVTVLTLDVDPATGGFLGSNHLDIAVSHTGDPTAGFNIYRLPVQDDGTQGTPTHRFCPCLGDYPHIGADANGIYLTTNEYSLTGGAGLQGNGFNGAQVYAISKKALAAGALNAKVVQFDNTGLADGTTTVPGFTIWPASSPAADFRTTNGGTEYLLSSIASRDEANNATGFANRIGVYALMNTSTLDTAAGAPTLRRALRPSEVYGVPPLSEQKAGSTPLRDCIVVGCLPTVGPPQFQSADVEGPLDSSDSRMQQVWFAAGHIWGALGTVVRVDGQIKTGIAYFILDPGNGPPTANVIRQGYVALSRNNVIFPSIATLPNGNGVMAVNVVGPDYFPSSAYVHIDLSTTGPLNVAAAGVGPQDGFSEYSFYANPSGSLPRPRWGDYSTTVTDGTSIWTGTEYIAQTCQLARYQKDPSCGGTRLTLGNWSTRLSRINP